MKLKRTFEQQVLEADLMMDWNGHPVWPETAEDCRRLYLERPRDRYRLNIMIGLSPEETERAIKIKRAQGN
jgi:hypothetical protein